MMNTTLSITHSLFPSAFEADFSTKIPLNPSGLPRFCDALLNQLLPPVVFDGGDLIDMKGQGGEDGEELLFIDGMILPGEDGEGQEPFSLRCTTSFKNFVGRKQIAYEVKLDSRGSLFSVLSPRELGLALSVQLQSVRLGIGFFEANFFGMWFGFSPTVRKSIIVSVTGGILDLSLHAEGLKSRSENPFELHEGLALLARLLRDLTGEDLAPFYRQVLREQTR